MDQYASTWRGNQEDAELVLPVGSDASCQDIGWVLDISLDKKDFHFTF